jgi:predicted RNA-binding Zn-ribbon protein involved in translation (DUF1610 family)
MTFLRFKLSCNCKNSYESTEMILVEDDMAWTFECPRCGNRVDVENWTSEDADEKEAAKKLQDNPKEEGKTE